jgi:hypothetical protein
MKIKAERQSSNMHEPRAGGGSNRLPFDPEKYRKYLAETDWSEKGQDEWPKIYSQWPKGLRTPATSVSHQRRPGNAAGYSDTKLMNFRP